MLSLRASRLGPDASVGCVGCAAAVRTLLAAVLAAVPQRCRSGDAQGPHVVLAAAHAADPTDEGQGGRSFRGPTPANGTRTQCIPFWLPSLTWCWEGSHLYMWARHADTGIAFVLHAATAAYVSRRDC